MHFTLMPLQDSLYRTSKRAMEALPPWLLRVRPFGVYEISLDDVPEGDVLQAGSLESATETRWISNQGELSLLQGIADPMNLARWDAQTHRVAITLRGGEPMGVAWISTQRFDETELGLRFELAERDAWLHSAYVPPSHRQQGTYRQVLRFVVRSLRDEGYERLLLGVSSGNTPSLRAHQGPGAVRIGHVAAIRSLGISVCRTAGQVWCMSGRRFGVGREVALRVRQA